MVRESVSILEIEKVECMSTKSFTTDFKINKKTNFKLTDALDHSRRVDYQIKQKVETVTDRDRIQKMMSSFIGK